MTHAGALILNDIEPHLLNNQSGSFYNKLIWYNLLITYLENIHLFSVLSGFLCTCLSSAFNVLVSSPQEGTGL